MTFRRVARADDLWDGEMVSVNVGGVPVLLVNLGGEVRAYDDRCPHQGVSLGEGRLEGHVLKCAAHHWCFDARTGQGVNPRRAVLRPLPVRVEGDDILVDVDGEPGAARGA